MFEVLATYLRKRIEITDDELELIRAACAIRAVRKWQPMLQAGEIWGIKCFVASGCLRLYRTGTDGKDYTLRFAVDNWWLTDLESYNQGKPSSYNIEALMASTVIVCPKEKWMELLVKIPALSKLHETLMLNNGEANQRRIFSLISSSAEEKYNEFKKTYPGIFNRVPLYMVASHLGISRETLSRLRKEHAKQNKETSSGNL